MAIQALPLFERFLWLIPVAQKTPYVPKQANFGTIRDGVPLVYTLWTFQPFAFSAAFCCFS